MPLRLFLPVRSAGEITTVATLAENIWMEHYFSLLGEKQIRYMLEKFQSEKAIADQIQNEGYRYYLLMADSGPKTEEAVGYMGIKEDGEGRLFLSKLYLDKAARGKGYARQGLAFLEGVCRGRDLSAVWLTVNRHNTNAIAVYEKLGFVKTREQVADIGQGFVMDDYIMEKSIKINK